MLKVITITRDRISDSQLPWVWNITCHLKLTIKITLDARVLQLNHEILWYFNTGDSRSQCWNGHMAVSYSHLVQAFSLKGDAENVSLPSSEATREASGQDVMFTRSVIPVPCLALNPYPWIWAGEASQDAVVLDWAPMMLPHCGPYDLKVI